MSLQPDAAQSDGGLPPPSVLQQESVTEVLTRLDGVIEHASSAQRHSRHVGDDKAFGALDDAISLLQHVRSRLQYDLAPDAGQNDQPS